MLAWFVTFLAVAALAPWVQAQPTQTLCTSAGVVQTALPGAGDSGQHAAHVLKCPLCSGICALPATPAQPAHATAPLAYALLPVASARVTPLAGAPLPARGPPSFS